MPVGKDSRIVTVTLPENVYNRLLQYCESMSIKKSVAVNQLIQQGLEANMALNTLDKLMEMLQQEAKIKEIAKTIDG